MYLHTHIYIYYLYISIYYMYIWTFNKNISPLRIFYKGKWKNERIVTLRDRKRRITLLRKLESFYLYIKVLLGSLNIFQLIQVLRLVGSSRIGNYVKREWYITPQGLYYFNCNRTITYIFHLYLKSLEKVRINKPKFHLGLIIKISPKVLNYSKVLYESPHVTVFISFHSGVQFRMSRSFCV